jgi:hypothetical protein
MVLDFDNLRLLVANGGGVTVDASKYTVQQLTLLAAHAAASGAQLTVEGFSGLSSDDLRTIAANGKGKVIFSGKSAPQPRAMWRD